MIDHIYNGRQTDCAVPDLFMAILVTVGRILAVIQMDRAKSVKTDVPVKLPQHTVQIIDDIIPRVMHMTNIKTDPYFLIQLTFSMIALIS